MLGGQANLIFPRERIWLMANLWASDVVTRSSDICYIIVSLHLYILPRPLYAYVKTLAGSV